MQEEEVRGPIELTEEKVDEPSDNEENEEGNYVFWNVEFLLIFVLVIKTREHNLLNNLN